MDTCNAAAFVVVLLPPLTGLRPPAVLVRLCRLVLVRHQSNTASVLFFAIVVVVDLVGTLAVRLDNVITSGVACCDRFVLEHCSASACLLVFSSLTRTLISRCLVLRLECLCADLCGIRTLRVWGWILPMIKVRGY